MTKLNAFQVGRKILVFYVVTLTFACSSMQFRITNRADPNFDFSQIKDFQIVKNKQDKIESLKVDRKWLDQTITSAIRETLQSKGLIEKDDQARFTVSYYVVAEIVTDAVMIDNYYNSYYQYTPYPASSLPQYKKLSYEKGTLVIDIVNNKTHQRIWRGTAESVLGKKTDQKRREQNIKNAVTDVFKKFPP